MPRIRDIAQVCKSKNAGPFDVTIDVMFAEEEVFRKVERSGVLRPELFAELYGVRPKEVLLTIYEPGRAFKATLPRLFPAGEVGDTDVYGAQQHAPLLEVEIPF
jgi:hypothetical protein